MQLMNRLKNILQSKIFYLLILVIALLYTSYTLLNYKVNVKNDNILVGIITDIKINNNKLSLEVKGKEKILLNYYINDKDEFSLSFKLGDKIKAIGNYKIPKENTVFNLFNYKNYLLSKNIRYLFEVENLNDILKLKSNENFMFEIKNNLIKYVDSFKSSNYLKTFLLGDNNIENIYKNSYQTNGISHLFSISGMHITLFAILIEKTLSSILKNKKHIYFVTYIFLIFYMFLTSFSPSVMRGSFLFILGSINKIFKLKIKTIYLLIFIFSLLLFYNPYLIYNMGFIFSFTVSFYLILCNKIINRFKNYFVKTLIISVIAFIVSLPISINNFFEINLLTPFINVIFVPLISFIVFPFSILTAFIKPLDIIFFNLTSLIEILSLLISKIDYFILVLKHIDIFEIFIYYLIINYILLCFYKNSYYQIIFLAIAVIIHSNLNYFCSDLNITMLDVGQGDSILIKLPYNKGNILIDTGGILNFNYKNDYSIVTSKTISFFKSMGIKSINYLLITHGDYDHIGEAINLVENFKVEKVIFNCGEFNDLEQELIKVLNKNKIPYYSCIKELNIDNNKLYFLQTKEYDNENDNSSVIYTELNNHKFLFMGDAGIEVEEDLIEKYNLKDIDVLKVGHHGSKTSSGEYFINEINPKYSIISVGKNNRYGHPNNSVLDNLDDSKIYRTDQDGSIMFKIKKNKLQIETCPL